VVPFEKAETVFVVARIEEDGALAASPVVDMGSIVLV